MRDADGIDLNLSSPDQGVFLAGARLTRQFVADGRGTVFTPYLKANLLQEIGGGNDIQLSGVTFTTGRFGRALQVGGGMTGAVTPRLSLHTDLAWQHELGNVGGSRGWVANVGLRYTFGN